MKTPVEWFVRQMFLQGYLNDSPMTAVNINHFVRQAKEMEKEQTIEFAKNCLNKNDFLFEIEQYYDETFKSE